MIDKFNFYKSYLLFLQPPLRIFVSGLYFTLLSTSHHSIKTLFNLLIQGFHVAFFSYTSLRSQPCFIHLASSYLCPGGLKNSL